MAGISARETSDELIGRGTMSSEMPCEATRSRSFDRESTDHVSSIFADGSPPQNLEVPPEGDMAYRQLHAERSAGIVGDWLRGEGADEGLVREVERLIRAHEVGGAFHAGAPF